MVLNYVGRCLCGVWTVSKAAKQNLQLTLFKGTGGLPFVGSAVEVWSSNLKRAYNLSGGHFVKQRNSDHPAGIALPWVLFLGLLTATHKENPSHKVSVPGVIWLCDSMQQARVRPRASAMRRRPCECSDRHYVLPVPSQLELQVREDAVLKGLLGGADRLVKHQFGKGVEDVQEVLVDFEGEAHGGPPGSEGQALLHGLGDDAFAGALNEQGDAHPAHVVARELDLVVQPVPGFRGSGQAVVHE